MDDFAQFKLTYFAECAELLSDVEAQLSELSSGSSDPEVLHAIFRAVHSIKAGAGAFKFTMLAEFSHEYEALLDRMRDGRIDVTEEGVELLFRASDVLSAMVEAAENEAPLDEEFGKQILDEILVIVRGEGAADAKPAKAEAAVETENTAEQDTSEKTYHISFAPKAELFKHANEPLLIVREMKTLGDVTAVPDLDKL
ncbi:MAG: Hpt domain-containing protein, partial [Sneathiellales bacterium]|nr:Hpt domain-containing protein [Sneathiellales bacterium]